MKCIRTALLLSIIVFMSTLFWPQLLDRSQLLFLSSACLLFLFIPYLRMLAVIPLTALYFCIYANLTLNGQLYPDASLINSESIATYVDGEDHNIIVQIVSLISENNRGYFKAKLIEIDSNQLNYSPLIEMRWYKSNLQFQSGQVHRFIVQFKPIYGRANPGGFDRHRWSYSEHIAYKATIKAHLYSIGNISNIRGRFYEKVRNITDNLHHRGLLLALSFADKSLIPYDKKLQIRNLGISHLFAISGLHIGLFFSFIYFFSSVFYTHLLPVGKMGWFSHRIMSASALFGAWGYAYLAGFSLPTQRAFLMLMVAVIIFSLKRQCFKKDLLLLVLFIVLLWDPLAVLSQSLWLSFLAVAIIVFLLWAFPPLKYHGEGDDNCSENGKSLEEGEIRYLSRHAFRKVFSYVKLLFFIQLGLTVMMLPIQLVIFSGVSLFSILVNMLAVPLFSLVIIPMVLLATFTSLLFPPLALALFTLCDFLLTQFFYITQFAVQSYQFLSAADGRLSILLLLVSALLLFFHFQSKKLRQLSYLFVLLLSSLLLLPKPQKGNIWFVDIIDVGQGLAVLIRSNGYTLLYDTGARYPSGFSMASSEVAPYLVHLGIKKIDHLVISHSDSDHAGGATFLLDTFDVGSRWSGEPLIDGSHFQQCESGDKWQMGTLNVAVLSPNKVGKNNNNNSCVLRISDGKHSVLLTGDIEAKQEKWLISAFGSRLHSDILLAPHHGSRYSSSDEFIKSVAPHWVIFSAGFMNHWGFPTPEVVERYQRESVKMANTGLSGLIHFQITPDNINMETFREDLAPYWYHHSFLSRPLDWIHK